MKRPRRSLVRVSPLAAVVGTCASIACLGALGCQHDEITSFPPGLNPLAADPVPPPGADGGDTYPEVLSPIDEGQTGDLGGAGYYYVNATGYVNAPIEDVWSAFKIPDVIVDRHNVSSYSVTNNVEKGYDVSFLTSYTDNNVVTVKFDITWREGAVAGTQSAPTKVSVVYQKTAGSSFISLMEGSIQLVSVTPNVTELQFVQRMNASNTNDSTIATWTREMFNSVVAQVHGKALP